MLPLKDKDPYSLTALIGANLIPFGGIFLFGWDVSYIVLLYWIENLVAGFYNILKITFLKISPGGKHLEKLFVIPFFCVHYGGFCAVHGIFLTVFFKIGDGAAPFAGGNSWLGPFIFLQLLLSVIAKIWASRPPEMIWAVIGLVISHGISFVENYLLGGEYRNSSIKKLMQQPYQRIVTMHIAILGGAIFIMKLNSPLPLLIILVVMKICIDLYLHKKSHVVKAEAGK
ncbi:MAG: DUF6498-containing protein [Desulfobulbales bacterium]